MQEQELGADAARAGLAGGSTAGISGNATKGARLLALWRQKVFELLVRSEAASLREETTTKALEVRADGLEKEARERGLRLEAAEASLALERRAMASAVEVQGVLKAQAHE